LKVLVTGANGFLGRHVVGEFLRRGHAVRALVRPAADVSKLGWDDRVEIFRGDLRAAPNLVEAFEGIDALVHLAAAVTGSEDVQFAATVVGTEKLLDAMARSQTKRLVLASSFSVYDWSRIHLVLDESSPLEADLYARDGYAIAKVWQERVARRMAQENGWQLTVLRPGFLWGPGHADLSGIGQRVGPAYFVFGPTRAMPLSYVENTASAFVTATENESAAAGQVFNVLDGEEVSAWRYAGTLKGRGPGSPTLRVPVPYWLAIATTRLAQWTSRRIFRGKGKLPSILVPCRFEARFKGLHFSDAKLRTALNWQQPVTFEEALRRTHRTGQSAAPAEQAPGATAPSSSAPSNPTPAELHRA
jgi:UDP-glucose 4-epimerase